MLKSSTTMKPFINDHEAIRNEESRYQPIPAIRTITQEEIQKIYFQIKEDIQEIIEDKLN